MSHHVHQCGSLMHLNSLLDNNGAVWHLFFSFFSVFITFVDNERNIDYHQPDPFKAIQTRLINKRDNPE